MSEPTKEQAAPARMTVSEFRLRAKSSGMYDSAPPASEQARAAMKAVEDMLPQVLADCASMLRTSGPEGPPSNWGAPIVHSPLIDVQNAIECVQQPIQQPYIVRMKIAALAAELGIDLDCDMVPETGNASAS